jgi:hypothetical protein
VCSRNEANPCFTISKTPGDGDCLFYSMIDVATEILRDHPPPGPVLGVWVGGWVCECGCSIIVEPYTLNPTPHTIIIIIRRQGAPLV